MAIIPTLNATGTAIQAIQAINAGAVASTTQLAAAFSVLTPAQTANLAVTQKLSAETFFLQMCASNMSDKAIVEAWNFYQAATAKGTDAAATDILTAKTVSLTNVLKGLGATMLANPLTTAFVAIAAAVTIALTIQKKYNEAIQESIEKAQELQDAYKQASDEISDNISAVKDLTDEFNTLSKGVGNHGENISLSADEYDRYLEIVKQLVDINPSLVKGYDDEGNAIIDKNNALQETINLLKEQQALELANATSDDNNWDIAKGLRNTYKQELKEAQEAQSELVWALSSALSPSRSADVFNQFVDMFGAQFSKLEDFDAQDAGDVWYWNKLFESIADSSADAGQIIEDNIGYINSLLDQNSAEAGAFRQALSAWQTAQKTADKAATAYQSHMKIIAQASAGYDALGNSSKDFLNTWIESQKLTSDMSKSDVEAITTNIQNMVRSLADGVEIDVSNIDTMSQKLSDLGKEMSEYEQGNVKLSIRPEVDLGDGNYATVLSGWTDTILPDDKTYAIHYTPILADGTMLSEDELRAELDRLLDGAVSSSDILEMDKVENGGKGIILRINAKLDTQTDDQFFDSENAWGQSLHEIQEEYYDLVRAIKETPEELTHVTVDLNQELDKLFTVDWDSLGGAWYETAREEAEAVIAHLVQALNLTDEQVIDLKVALGLTLVDPETGNPVDAHRYYALALNERLIDQIGNGFNYSFQDVLGLSTAELKIALSLDPSDYSGWSEFRSAIDDVNAGVEDLTSTVVEFKDQIDVIASYEDAYAELSQALGEFIENGNVSADTIAELIETFGETEALKDFVLLLGQEGVTAAQVKEALESLGEEHLSNSKILEQLTEETQDWAVTALKANGVMNAQEVVANRLAAQQLEVQYATELASLATWDEVNAFLEEKGASTQVIAALSALRTEQLKAKVAATDFTTASQTVTAALLTQAKAAGVSAQAISILSSIQSMQTLKDKYAGAEGYYDTLITSLQDRLNSLLASAESSLDLKVKVTPTLSSSSSSSAVEAYTAEIDKFREALEQLDRLQREQERVELHLSNTDDLDKQIEYHNQLISIYQDEQAAMHDLNEERDAYIQSGVDKLRNAGFDVEYDAVNNNFFVKNLEHLNELVASSKGEYSSMQEATNAYIKEIEALIDELDDLNEANIENSESWWDLQYAIREAKVNIVNNLKDIVSSASDAVDTIQNVYDVLKDAADEYAANGGFISIDAYQKIVELGPEYMQYLQDENGLLIINEEAINRVIAAKTEQLALENAMAYVERLRLALQEGSVEDLNQLLYATTEATDATWGLVYANLALLDLNSNQYQAALHNIQAIRSLATTAVASIGQVAGGFTDELNNMKSGLDDILDYVMDMLQDQVERQIDSLENLKDSYAEIIAQRKEMLELAQREKEYQDEVNDKTAELAKLESRRAALGVAAESGDRNAALELGSVNEQIKELQDELNDYQYEHFVETTEDALDTELENFEAQQDEKIKILEDSISSTQKIYSMALDYISKNWDTLYSELIQWNYSYGSNLESEISTAWENCLAAAQRYGSYIEALNNIDADIASASGASSGGYSNNIVVGSSDSNTASTREKIIHAIIKQMYANAQAWSGATATQRTQLEEDNIKLGARLDAEYGIKATRGTDGVWYVGNEKLFEKYRDYCFHNGGIVGGSNAATSNQDELWALLKKGEIVINESQQNSLWSILSSLSPVNALKEAISSMKSGSLMPSMANGTAPYVDASININGSIPEKQIMAVLKKQQRTVTNLVFKNVT